MVNIYAILLQVIFRSLLSVLLLQTVQNSLYWRRLTVTSNNVITIISSAYRKALVSKTESLHIDYRPDLDHVHYVERSPTFGFPMLPWLCDQTFLFFYFLIVGHCLIPFYIRFYSSVRVWILLSFLTSHRQSTFDVMLILLKSSIFVWFLYDFEY